MIKKVISGIILILSFLQLTIAQYKDWKYSGSLYILTTPEGADLPATTTVNDFPLLIRLNSDCFNFSQAMSGGDDIRFSTAAGVPLFYEIEEWESSKGTAAIWVRIPNIKGNTRQEIKMFWGKPGSKSESSGKAVFNESNGYLSVLHLNDSFSDAGGTVTAKNVGTSPTEGIIGHARHFNEGQGINCGEKITAFPIGANPSTSEVWVRANKPNVTILGWGNEERAGKVVIQFASPPKIRMDCYSSDANVSGESKLSMNQWIQVVHTFYNGDSRIYVNGRQDAISKTVKRPLSVESPAKMFIGGWLNEYLFDGDVDEVRISNVVRSADWIKLQYENQKPLNTLVGPLVKEGNNFSVSKTKVKISEGKSEKISATADGAQKIYWIIKRDGEDKVVAVDQLSFTLEAGRVVAETSFVLQFKAVYEKEVRIKNILVTVTDDIPEPQFSLRAPSTWNGRDLIEVLPVINNFKEMVAKGAGNLKYQWEVSGGAVIRQIEPDKLVLTRSQFSGKLTVKLTLNNGGDDFVASTSILVTEPKNDPWVQRSPGPDEKPQDNQFYARDDKNEGTLFYNGTLDKSADSVFLKIFANGIICKRESRKPAANNSYSFTAKLKPGLIKYRVEFGTIRGKLNEVIDTISNIVCGDAYIIDGQSNAEANDYGRAINPYTSDWVRSFGCAETSPDRAQLKLWGNAVSFDSTGAKLQIGYWGIELAKQIVENQKMPVCIINGSVGGSRIDVHQRNQSDKEDPETIYGRLLWRVKQAGLTHGIRGIFWHQGENDQGAAGPTGLYGWETYRQYFIDMASAWKQDYPNIQHYYIFQIWPRSCAMTEKGSDNMLREVQRTLPRWFSNMSIMSTLGIKPPGTCHFPPEGYAEFAHLISPLVERDNYGKTFDRSITPPDLKRAYYISDKKDEIALEFDQPVIWSDSLINQFYLDGESNRVISGIVSGKVIILRISPESNYKKISYLDSKSWSQDKLLHGVNGIAALTFYSVPLGLSQGVGSAIITFDPTVESLKQYETPEWFEDAKLGIYMHWGPQSIPGVATTKYARWMYEQGSKGYNYHIATYGHPSKFGYKDICKLFTAPNFDQAQADRLVKLYKQAGARYVVPVAVHHDNFDMWDSKYQPRFNSVATSGKDVVGMWKEATVKNGLRLGVASHVARTYRWLQFSHGADKNGTLAGVPYDGQNPEFADLYGVKWDDSGNAYPDFWYEQRSDVGPPEFEQQFENRMKDLIEKYHPDLYYTDGGIPFKQAGLNVLSHFYNENQKWNNGKLEAVATIKLDWTPNIAINNYEYEYPESVQHYHWQTDKTRGADWYWIRNATAEYKTASQVIHMLIDVVSSNGNLLLNVPLTPDGELEQETISLLTEMGKCLDIIGEAIFSTRCWVVAGDGSGDIRFTRNKENSLLYILTTGWPKDEILIKTLNSSVIDLKSLVSVTLVGSKEKLKYSQSADGLAVKVKHDAPYESPAFAFKLTFSGQIPMLSSSLTPVNKIP